MITLAFLLTVVFPTLVSAYALLGYCGADWLIRRGYCGADLMAMHTYTYIDRQARLTDDEIEAWISSL